MKFPRPSPLAVLGAAALVIAHVLAAPCVAVAQTPSAPPDETMSASVEQAEPLRAIQVSDIAGESQVVRARLAKFRTLTDLPPAIDSLQSRLREIRKQIERLEPQSHFERTDLSESLVNDQRAQWSKLADELKAGRILAGAYVEKLDGANTDLEDLRVVWGNTRQAAVDDTLPDTVLARIEDTNTGIIDTEEVVKERRRQVLALQNEIGQSEEVAASTIVRLVESERRAQEELFQAKHEPLWKLIGSGPSESERPGLPRPGWRDDPQVVPDYFKMHERAFVLFGVVVVALLAGMLMLGRHAPRFAEENPAFEPTARLLQRPFAAALTIAMLAFPATFELLPRAIAATFWAALPVTFIRLLPVLIGRSMILPVYGLTAWFALAWTRIFVVANPLVARWMLFFEGLLVVAFLIYLLRPSRLVKVERSGRAMLTIRAGMMVTIFLLVASVAANAIGSVSLAQLLDEGTLVGYCIAALAFTSMQILAGALVLGMRTRPARRFRVVLYHAPRVQRQLTHLLAWMHWGVWVYVTLHAFRVWDVVYASIAGFFQAEFAVGDLAVSPGDVTAFAFMIWASFKISHLVRFVLDEEVLPRASLPRGVPFAVSVFVRYAILLAGFLMAVTAAGFDIGRFALLVGALGVGIGIGLQDVVNNFVSGLLLLFERPIQRGDTVEVAGVRGEVTSIGLRASTVRTYEGAEMVIPNSQFVSQSFVNWTLSDRNRRVDVAVGVEYGTDPERVIQILIDVARANPKVLERPESAALMIGFGDSSLNFELRAWTAETATWMAIRSQLTVGIDRALKEAGITIPFPQRDLHVRSVVGGAPPDGGS